MRKGKLATQRTMHHNFFVDISTISIVNDILCLEEYGLLTQNGLDHIEFYGQNKIK